MKQLRNGLALAVFLFSVQVNAARAQQSQPAAPHTVDLKSTDGTLLKATFFPAAKPGPGVLLFHQSNRTRASWDEVARRIAAAGINTLTIDERGYGESSGKKDARELYRRRLGLRFRISRFAAGSAARCNRRGRSRMAGRRRFR